MVVTRPPASLHIRAAALSSANPRLPNTPAREQAARWWPKESSKRPHRQTRREKGRGIRRRRNRRTRKSCGSMRVKMLLGVTVRATPLPVPLWDLTKAARTLAEEGTHRLRGTTSPLEKKLRVANPVSVRQVRNLQLASQEAGLLVTMLSKTVGQNPSLLTGSLQLRGQH